MTYLDVSIWRLIFNLIWLFFRIYGIENGLPKINEHIDFYLISMFENIFIVQFEANLVAKLSRNSWHEEFNK